MAGKEKFDPWKILAERLENPETRDEELRYIAKRGERIDHFKRIAQPMFDCFKKHGIEYHANPLENIPLTEQQEIALVDCIRHSYSELDSLEAQRYAVTQLFNLKQISVMGEFWWKLYQNCDDYVIRHDLISLTLRRRIHDGAPMVIDALSSDSMTPNPELSHILILLDVKRGICKDIAYCHYNPESAELSVAIATRLPDFGIQGVKALKYCGTTEAIPHLESYLAAGVDDKTAREIERCIKRLKPPPQRRHPKEPSQ